MRTELTPAQESALRQLDDLPVEALPAALAALVTPATTTDDALLAMRPVIEALRQAAYADGYNEGGEVAREDFAAHLAGGTVEDVRAALDSGDLRDLEPRNVEHWAAARRAAQRVTAGAR